MWRPQDSFLLVTAYHNCLSSTGATRSRTMRVFFLLIPPILGIIAPKGRAPFGEFKVHVLLIFLLVAVMEIVLSIQSDSICFFWDRVLDACAF